MARTIWIALVCLIFICGLAALKVSLATAAKQQDAFAEPASVADLQPVLFKADKLNMPNVDDAAPDKKIVRILPIVPSKVTQPAPQQKVTRIVSRHWHQGESKFTKRTARYHRDASRVKRKEYSESQSSPRSDCPTLFCSKKNMKVATRR
jgi:hypothetical protein